MKQVKEKFSLSVALLFIFGMFFSSIILLIDFNNHINIMTFLLIFLAILLYIYNYFKNNKDALNPDGVFSLIWLICLGLSNLRLSQQQYEWDLLTWSVLIFSWLFYLLGSKLPEFMLVKKHRTSLNKNISKKGFSFKKFKRNVLILFFISFFSFVIEVIAAGYIPIFASNMSAYVGFGLPFIHYNTVAMSVVIILSFFYLLNNKSDKVMKIIFIMGFLQIISILSRQLLIFTFIGLVIVYHYYKKKFSLKKISVTFLIFVVLFSVIGGIRNQSLDYLYYVANIKPGVGKSFLMWPYLYFTMGFENMRSLLHIPMEHTLGRYTLTPIWALSRLVTLFPKSGHIEYLTIPEFNVSTYLRDYYFDFGLIGVLLFPFLIGIVSKTIYIKLRSREGTNSIYLFLNIFVLHNLIFTFFVNFYSNTSIMINVIYVLLVFYLSYNSFNKNQTI